MILRLLSVFNLFFFNVTPTTEIYTLSLHDALPICNGADAPQEEGIHLTDADLPPVGVRVRQERAVARGRSEEHTSEFQSPMYLVCRLLLEKKKWIYARTFFRSNYNAPAYVLDELLR